MEAPFGEIANHMYGNITAWLPIDYALMAVLFPNGPAANSLPETPLFGGEYNEQHYRIEENNGELEVIFYDDNHHHFFGRNTSIFEVGNNICLSTNAAHTTLPAILDRVKEVSQLKIS